MADRFARRSGDDYGEALLNLLPRGQAWPKDEEADAAIATNALAQIMGDVDDRAADMIEIESDPTKTTEMLDQWEVAFGLPDPLIPQPPTAEVDRRKTLVARMTMLGAQDRQFFIDQATLFGMTVTIREFAPYLCGISRCGDTRMASLTDDIDHFRWQLGVPETRFYWSVKVTALLSNYTGADMLALLNRWKPAHTKIVFDYSLFNEGDFSRPWYSGNISLF